MKKNKFIDYKNNKFQWKMTEKVFNIHLKNVSRVCLGLFGFIFFDVECFVISPGLFVFVTVFWTLLEVPVLLELPWGWLTTLLLSFLSSWITPLFKQISTCSLNRSRSEVFCSRLQTGQTRAWPAATSWPLTNSTSASANETVPEGVVGTLECSSALCLFLRQSALSGFDELSLAVTKSTRSSEVTSPFFWWVSQSCFSQSEEEWCVFSSGHHLQRKRMHTRTLHNSPWLKDHQDMHLHVYWRFLDWCFLAS